MSSNKKEKLVIIDGNALIHRAFHALPPLATPDGQLVNAVYGFALILFKLYKDLKPDYLVLTLDRAKKTFRHEQFAEYKATRVKQPDEFYEQIPIVEELARAFNIPIFALEGYEADDLIGTIVRQTEKMNGGLPRHRLGGASQGGGKIKNIIVTGDMDTLQLVNDDTEIFTLKKGINDTITYDAAAVRERYGINPDQMIDYKGLRGDPSDNIPGVRGIGEKTASELLQKFGTLEHILAAAKAGDEKIKERYRGLLIEHEADAIMSKQLATIMVNVPIEFSLTKAALQIPDRQAVFQLFQRLGFKSLLNRLNEIDKMAGDKKQGDLFEVRSPESRVQREEFKIREGYHLIQTEKELASLVKKLKDQEYVAIDTETTSLSEVDAKLLGVGLCFKDAEAYYIDWLSEELKDKSAIVEILEDKKIKKVGHNLKYDFAVLKQNGIDLAGIYFDSMLADYLLNPGTRSHSLDNLTFTEFGVQKITTESLIGKGKKQINMAEVPVAQVADYCCEDVDYTWRLFEKLSSELEQKNQLNLLEKIELPLVQVLAEMELTGVKVDVPFIQKFDKKINAEREKLDKKIFKLAGGEFNIDSPLQLKEVLFDKLKISTEGIKKIKTGISTAAPELEKLSGRHEIIDLISEHRELAKLQSTYTQALPELVNKKTGRVHTSYNQTVTATGRLSSSDPNLQNIPIRTELGREVRKAFVAERGNKIIKADYSQIELRIVASLARDQRMLEIFSRGEDIHKATAAEINGVSLDEVTKEMRYKAKEVNFGVLYGMGAYGLSWRAKISRDEARYFIEKYFAAFSGVKDFIDETIRLARERGYVETLFGRARYLPEINSSIAQIKNAAERMAINAPIQGTAADLMKLAMIAVSQKLKAKYIADEVKMMLQVHDELVFEVKEKLVPEVAKLVRHEMENVYKLRVPIVVDVEVGDNWGETKPINN